MILYAPGLPRPATAATPKGAGNHSMPGARPERRKPLYDRRVSVRRDTVKATLPEPQSPGILMAMVPQQRLTRHPGMRCGTSLLPHHNAARRSTSSPGGLSRPGPSSIWRGKVTNGAPSHAASLLPRNHGMPYSRRGSNPRPVWARSSHSTRTLGATPETAVRRLADGRAYKERVTDPKALPVGGRGTAPLSPAYLMGRRANAGEYHHQTVGEAALAAEGRGEPCAVKAASTVRRGDTGVLHGNLEGDDHEGISVPTLPIP
jgi:hypothetical protein